MKNNKWHICYLAEAPLVHTQRWVRHFSKKGHRITVISFGDQEIDGADVVYIKPLTSSSRLNYLLSAPRIRRLINKLKPDILHAHYATGYGLVGALTGWHPYVVTAWGSDVLISPVESIIYRFLIKFVFRQADLVTSMADHMTEHLISHRYVSKEKVLTLPFGVNINRFYPEQSKQPDKKSRFTVISTRRHNITCDVQTYIRAIPIILEQFPETCFLVGGDGPMREDLETLVKDLEIQKQVSFVGWIPYREMPEYLRRSDVAISTAVSDGNNVSLNEAMACGTFPIASNISANRQWIISEINGLLFKSGDYQDLASCVIRALSDFEMRENAVDLNWRIIKSRASWNKNMNKMTSYYKNLVLGIRD